MINNRWLVELLKEEISNNSVTIKSNWLNIIDNASSWAGYWSGPNHWQDTHIYTPKQMREKALEAYKRQEERHREWLKKQFEYD
jgi:hypothetical protein